MAFAMVAEKMSSGVVNFAASSGLSRSGTRCIGTNWSVTTSPFWYTASTCPGCRPSRVPRSITTAWCRPTWLTPSTTEMMVPVSSWSGARGRNGSRSTSSSSGSRRSPGCTSRVERVTVRVAGSPASSSTALPTWIAW